MSEKNAAVWTELKENELRALFAQGVVKNFSKNTVIVSEGDETDSLYIVIAGSVKVFVSDEEGRKSCSARKGRENILEKWSWMAAAGLLL